ncbi:MAG: 3D domain-containing protein [Eubacteriales bacterium]
MKFIGIPKTVKKKNEALRSVIGALLLFSLIVVCVVGAESVFTGSRITTSAPDDTLTAVTTPADSSEMAPLNVDSTVPDLNARSDDSINLTTGTTAIPTDPSAASVTVVSATLSATIPPETTAAVTETAETGHYYVTAVLTIRSGPGTEFGKVGAYASGDELDAIAATSNGWKKIADAKYVIDDFLSATPPETELSGTYYAIGEINVRSGPGTGYDITKTLAAGDAITVVARTSTGWYRTAKGTYVNSSLCTSTPPATPTPKPTPSPTPKPTPTPVPTPAPGEKTLVGSFKVTFYGPTGNNTHSGAPCIEGRTVAVDPSVIPLGTKLYIEGISMGPEGDGYFIAEDTGSAVKGNIVDIFANDGESSSYSTKYNINVYIVN